MLFVPDFVDEITTIVSPDTTATMLSIARCGLVFKANDFSVWKHDLPSPGLINQCLGDKFMVEDAAPEFENNQFCADLPAFSSKAEDLIEKIDESFVTKDENCPSLDQMPEGKSETMQLVNWEGSNYLKCENYLHRERKFLKF